MFLWPRFKTWWQWKMATVFLFSSQDFRTTQGSGLGFKYFPGVLCCSLILPSLFFFFLLVSEYQLVISDMFPSFKGTTMLSILVRNVIVVAVFSNKWFPFDVRTQRGRIGQFLFPKSQKRKGASHVLKRVYWLRIQPSSHHAVVINKGLFVDWQWRLDILLRK